MIILKALAVSGIILIYLALFFVKKIEYENKQMNDILKYDDSITLLANEVKK